MKQPIPANGTEPLKAGDRVRIVPEFQDPGDDRFERFVIEAPDDCSRVRIRTIIPGFSILPVEWIEADKLILLQPQVIPHEFLADATIPETHRPALISWLRTLDGRSPTVHLTWETPGHLTLTHWDSGMAQATIKVPVGISGEVQPPAISFAPRYLAEALAIGPVLRLIDGISPGLTANQSGCYCVIMPCRFTEVAEEAGDKAAAPVPAMAA